MKKFTLLCLLILASFNLIAQTGLIGCYSLDNNANDYSGYGYHGTAFNVTPSTDHLGNQNMAYNFSGSGSYISIPDSAFRLNEYTYSIWCKPTSLPPSGNVYSLLAIGGTNADQYIGLVNLPSMSIIGFHFTSYDNTGTFFNACSQGFLPTINQWYHIVVTRNNDSLTLYVDGSLICTQTLAGTNAGYLGSPVTATVGSRGSANFQNFVGDIDNVKIFNRALSDSEIASMSDSSCFPTSISEKDLLALNLAKIFPNPFSHTATVQIGDYVGLRTDNYDLQFTMYDLLGKAVFKSEISDSQSEIQRGYLSGGVYFYKITQEKKTIAKGKVIIQ